MAQFFSPQKSGESADEEPIPFKPALIKNSVSPIMDAFDRDMLLEELERNFFDFKSLDEGMCLVESVELSVAEIAREIHPEAFENIVTTNAIWNMVVECAKKGRYHLKQPGLAEEFPHLKREIQALHLCERVEELDADAFNVLYEAMKV